MKKILVLGGGGFIGSNLVRELIIRNNCCVVSADLGFPRKSHEYEEEAIGKKQLRLVSGDFTNIQLFDTLGDSFDEVYFLAAVVGVNRTLEEPEEVIRINTMLTMNTLNWIRGCSIKRLLFASSSENYAGTFESFGAQVPTPETVPLCVTDIRHPRFTYAITKMHGESAFINSARALGYSCVVVRYQNIIGPNMGFRHAIPHIVERMLVGNEIFFKVYGSSQTRAFCHVSDAVNGTIGAMECYSMAGEIYHIGNDQEVTIGELTREVGRLIGYQGEYVDAMTYPGSVGRRCPDISKCYQHFGYKPVIDWKNAVADTVNWYFKFFSAGGKPLSGGFIPPERYSV